MRLIAIFIAIGVGMFTAADLAMRDAKRVGRNSGPGLLLGELSNGGVGRCSRHACSRSISIRVRLLAAVGVMDYRFGRRVAGVCCSEVSCRGRVSRWGQLSPRSTAAIVQTVSEKVMLIVRNLRAQITFFRTAICSGLSGGVSVAASAMAAQGRMVLPVSIFISSGLISGRPGF